MTDRTRIRDNLRTQTAEVWLTCNGCAKRDLYLSSTHDVAILGRREEMTDTVTPGFAKRMREGALIVNPMVYKSEDHSASGSYSHLRSVAYACTTVPKCYLEIDYKGLFAHAAVAGSPVGGSKPAPASLITSDEKSRVLRLAATSAQAAVSRHDAQVLEDLAEISQLLGMLKDPLQTGHKFLSKISQKARRYGKGKGPSAQDAADYAASMWLQYRFGIRPVISTINGVIKALTKDRTPGLSHRQTSRGSETLFASDVVYGTSLVGDTGFDYVYNYGEEYSVRCGLITDQMVTLAQDIGVDASSMLALPWNLVPLSFVADWLANVNTFIQALVPLVTTRPLASWTTTQLTSTVTFQVTSSWAMSPSTRVLLRPVAETRSSTYVHRTRTPGMPLPSLAFRPRAISGVLNDLRVVDSLALFAVNFDRVFKR